MQPSCHPPILRPLVMGALSALLLTTAAAARIQSAQDPEADFSSFRTFAFRPAESMDEFMAARIEGPASEVLQKKGLRQVGLDENPDLYIDYAVGSGDILYADYRYTLGWWNTIWRIPGGSSSVQAGILIVLSDAVAGGPVWGALATMRGNNPESLMVMEGRVPGQVTKMMKKYPGVK